MGSYYIPKSSSWKIALLTTATVAVLLAQQPPQNASAGRSPIPAQSAPAQPAAPAQKDPNDSGVIIRSTTRLIQVNVLVHNHKGEPVRDLKKEDFQLLDNGKPQKVAIFSMDTNTVLPQEKPLPQNVFTNKLAVRGGVPTSVTVILLDAMNTKYQDQIWSRKQVVKYLATLKPEDRVAIYQLGYGQGLRVLHDFTTDSSDLVAKLSKFKSNLADITPAEGGTSFDFDPAVLDFSSWMGGGGASRAEADFYTINRVTGTLRAIEFIANHLSELPGRKNLIWVSGGFPMQIGFDSVAAFHDPSRQQRSFGPEMDEAIRALNNGNVSIYPVDSRGLEVDHRFSAENQKVNLAPKLSMGPSVENQQTMSELASRTGGRAYYNTNDLAKALREAVEDSVVSYTLGFYPADERFDGKFHKLEVKVPELHGMNLRYRKGYFDLAEQPKDEQRRHIEIRDAVFSPLDSSSVGVVVQIAPADPKHPGDLNVYLRVDPTAIGITPAADRSNAILDFIFVQRDEKGHQFKSDDDTMTLALKPDTYQKIMREGLIYHRFVPRIQAATQLRIVVRDASSGSTGSVTVPFSSVKL